MSNTLASFEITGRLKLFSGNCAEATVKTSISVNSINANATGISFDDEDNTPWCGDAIFDDKLYLFSGQFTSTFKASLKLASSVLSGISFNSGENTPYAQNSKLKIGSGQFSATVKDSFDPTRPGTPRSIIEDGDGNSPTTGLSDAKLYLFSGHMTDTLKTSLDVSGVDTAPSGISVDSDGNTPWCGELTDKGILQSGQFSGTIKDSVDLGNNTVGIENDGLPNVLGFGGGGAAPGRAVNSGWFLDILS